jgi:hypothetical protein
MVPLRNVPGPDRYQVNLSQTRAAEKKWAFGHETQRPGHGKLSSTTDGVGPSTYDWDKLPKKGHMALFHKDTRMDLRNRTAADIYIGPGKYSVDQGNIEKNIEKRIGWSITKDSQIDRVKRVNPGPGAYESITQERSVTGTVFGDEGRLEFGATGIDHLGPGKYEPYRSTLANTMGRFGKDHREIHKTKKFNVEKERGPGQYHWQKAPKTKLPDYSFGKDPRKPIAVPSNVPGPGAYDEKVFINSSNKTSSPKFSVGHDVRRDEVTIKDHVTKTPGAGRYELRQEIGLGGPKWSVGKDARKDLSEAKFKTPGAGTYDVKASIPDTPKY